MIFKYLVLGKQGISIIIFGKSSSKKKRIQKTKAKKFAIQADDAAGTVIEKCDQKNERERNRRNVVVAIHFSIFGCYY